MTTAPPPPRRRPWAPPQRACPRHPRSPPPPPPPPPPPRLPRLHPLPPRPRTRRPCPTPAWPAWQPPEWHGRTASPVDPKLGSRSRAGATPTPCRPLPRRLRRRRQAMRSPSPPQPWPWPWPRPPWPAPRRGALAPRPPWPRPPIGHKHHFARMCRETRATTKTRWRARINAHLGQLLRLARLALALGTLCGLPLGVRLGPRLLLLEGCKTGRHSSLPGTPRRVSSSDRGRIGGPP